MKKYCLTQCAKDKFSTAWEDVIGIILGVLITISVMIVLGIALALLGFIIQLIAFACGTWWFHYFVLDTAGLALIGTGLVVWISYHGFHIIKWLYIKLFYVSKNIVMNIFDPSHAECRLFEECKD